MNARFSLGIDLGTSNSAVAADNFESDEATVVEITQILRPNQIGESSTLPSALYLPHPDEFPADAIQLPVGQQLADSNHRTFCARTWSADAGSARNFCEILALQFSR